MGPKTQTMRAITAVFVLVGIGVISNALGVVLHTVEVFAAKLTAWLTATCAATPTASAAAPAAPPSGGSCGGLVRLNDEQRAVWSAVRLLLLSILVGAALSKLDAPGERTWVDCFYMAVRV